MREGGCWLYVFVCLSAYLHLHNNVALDLEFESSCPPVFTVMQSIILLAAFIV